MKIIALHYSTQSTPQVRLLADSSTLASNKPFFLPDFAESFTIEASVALRVCRLGKCIARRFAHRYYDAAAASVIVTAHNPLQAIAQDGSALGYAFDGALWLGDFKALSDLQSTTIELLKKSDDCDYRVTGSQVAMTADEIIEVVSQYFTLKMGDIIVTGNCTLPTPIAIGDTVEASIGGEPSLKIRVK